MIVRHINISLRIFYQMQKKLKKEHLDDVVNNLNTIDFYLYKFTIILYLTKLYLKFYISYVAIRYP